MRKMAVIEVNHRFLRDVASAADTYCSAQNREMLSADQDIKSMLSKDWLGPDSMEFGGKWEKVASNDSITVKFRELIKGFGESLTACANEYENAQGEVYNMANRLPKYLYW